MNFFKTFSLFFAAISLSCAYALEIDEKLTLRILGTSSSKKTILINRGVEDGLVAGDHAKFFQATGVVARGVVLKVSPTRSIWSIYRLTDPTVIVKSNVINLKITAPVKLTKDPSRSLREDEGTTTAIALAPGADDTPKDLSRSEEDDLASLAEDASSSRSSKSESGIDDSKTWEVWGSLSYASLGSTITEDSTESTANITNIDGGVGVEKYFGDNAGFIHNLSLFAFAESNLSGSIDLEGYEPSTYIQYGAGVNVHFVNDPFSYGKFIPFLSFSGGLGTATNTFNNEEASGGLNFYNVGAGLKYYFSPSLGVRAIGSYYARSETYSFEGGSVSEVTVASTGMRGTVALSYRF